MLYALMKTYHDGSVGQSGKTHKQLKRLKNRLKKVRQGYIVQINPDMSKKVVCARGYSRQAMQAIAGCGVEIIGEGV